MLNKPHQYVVAVFLSLAVFFAAAPLALGVTAEQMKMFQQLSADERAKIMDQLSPEEQQALRQATGSGQQPSPPPQTPPEVVKSPEEAPKAPERAGDLPYFGYDLFEGVPTTFAPATDIPIPSDYVVGPGDTIQLQLYGKTNAEYTLVVSRDGTVQVPEIGPKTVAGLKFSELQQRLQSYVQNQMIGVKAYISMGPLRSIRVFVLGDVNRSGSYTVSALSTMTNALFVSGGIKKPIGSLRSVQLKREGKTAARLDLYDLLIRGDTSADSRLLPGDVIFVPPVGKTAGVSGAVRRPAVYELKNERTVAELIQLAGGLLPTAARTEARLNRISETGQRVVIDIDLEREQDKKRPLADGDRLAVQSVLDRVEAYVQLTGHVERPGRYEWFEGMRLNDLITDVEADLQPRAELDYVLIKRELPPDRRIEVFSARLNRALAVPDSLDNVRLEPFDEVRVFGIGEDRAETIQPLIAQLKRQASFENPERVVTISGHVRFPGEYPLEAGMTVSDLIRAGDLQPQPAMDYVMISREVPPDRRIEVLSTRLGEAIDNPDSPADVALKARDRVRVFGLAEDRAEAIGPVIDQLRSQARIDNPEKVVSAVGLVAFPGQYPLEDNMRISDLVRAAGNLRQQAYKLSAELVRFQVFEDKIRETMRLPVELEAALAGAEKEDLMLRPFDALHIKQMPDWREQRRVEISGEVLFPGTYVVGKDETLLDLIDRAGGFNDRAFLDGSVFVREDLRQKEQRQLDRLRDQLRADLAAISLEQAQEDQQKKDALAMAQSLVQQLESTQAVGRLVIDLQAIAYGTAPDITLQDQDRIIIPDKPQEVTVLGEVNFPTSHVFVPDLSRDDYIERSGGMTYKADKGRTYVIRASGEVLGQSTSWFSMDKSPDIRVGDTIVVPLDADRIRPLYFWNSVAQIVYQISLSIAAANAVGVF
ncbi:MAG: SLBB domain-containing protein [Desulfobacterales bacterium]|nr:SLBB domain-containing protein [Desulfobacterales bacterium]